MPGKLPIVYWDACVFLAHLSEEAGRHEVIGDVIEAIRDGRSPQIHTSVLSRVEMAFSAAERAGRVLDPIIDKTIEDMRNDTTFVTMVELHELVAIKAKDLSRRAMAAGVKLSANDAVHLGTAVWLRAAEFHTFDRFKGRPQDIEQLAGIRICEPYVLKPRLPGT